MNDTYIPPEALAHLRDGTWDPTGNDPNPRDTSPEPFPWPGLAVAALAALAALAIGACLALGLR